MAAQLIDDPPPTAFVAALAVLVITSLITHHLHRNNRYQNHLLALGLAGVVIATRLRQYTDGRPLLQNIHSYVPLGLVVASIVSSMAHAIGRAARRGAARRDEPGHKRVIYRHDLDEKTML